MMDLQKLEPVIKGCSHRLTAQHTGSENAKTALDPTPVILQSAYFRLLGRPRKGREKGFWFTDEDLEAQNEIEQHTQAPHAGS